MHAGLGKKHSGRVQISGLEKTSSLKSQIVCKKTDQIFVPNICVGMNRPQKKHGLTVDLMKDQVLSKNVFIS